MIMRVVARHIIMTYLVRIINFLRRLYVVARHIVKSWAVDVTREHVHRRDRVLIQFVLK